MALPASSHFCAGLPARLRQLFPNAIRLSVALGLLSQGAPPLDAAPADKTSDVLLLTMQQELLRATGSLAKSDPPPYFLSYSVYDDESAVVVASYGGLLRSFGGRRRSADVIMRVGAPALDNTHNESRGSALTSGALPLGDDRDAIARELWRLTNLEYRRAAPAFLNVKTSATVRSAEEDLSPDFSTEPPQSAADNSAISFKFDEAGWNDKIRRYSAYFRKYPEVYSSGVFLQMDSNKFRFISSEGTKITTGGAMARLVIQAETRAEDGMELLRVETFQAATPEGFPAEPEIAKKIEKMAADLKALRAAPIAEPFDGPAMLSGRAAAVFFHEVLGHRMEGQRQRGDQEGQTFTKKVNQLVMPDFVSVVDDPTLKQLNGMPLSGAYSYDEEGVPASRVEIIKDGVLKSFLLSRMPIKNFNHSNGHGRGQAGRMPTARQGNLIVSSARSVKAPELREKFIEEIKKQGKPYGLYFEDVQGGFTLTTRALPQAFQVLPVIVWRVYPDGRPDELVRGVDIVGTPLAAVTRILLTDNAPQVFNGICGAESGQVPVSAVAPAMLFSEMEVQKRAQSHSRPPILPPPGFDTGAAKIPDGSAMPPVKPSVEPPVEPPVKP
ncbi:MAG: peptidase U62 [Acidipila sp.]|nr:peptidase U62 [Acidipila sp.]